VNIRRFYPRYAIVKVHPYMAIVLGRQLIDRRTADE
jgi:hypothetical protein